MLSLMKQHVTLNSYGVNNEIMAQNTWVYLALNTYKSDKFDLS